MGWGLTKKEEDLPEQLRGKSPEDILKIINANTELETRIKSFEDGQATKDAELAETKSQVEQLRVQLQQLSANREEPAQPQQQYQTPSVLDNEDAAFQARLAPLQLATMQNLAQTARMQARDAILSADDFEARFFRKYQAEVEQLFSTMPLQHQTIAGSYINCFNVVKGRHMKEAIDAKSKDDGAAFSETASTGQHQVEEKDDKPTERDRQQAKKFGLDPEKYFQARKNMKIVA